MHRCVVALWLCGSGDSACPFRCAWTELRRGAPPAVGSRIRGEWSAPRPSRRPARPKHGHLLQPRPPVLRQPPARAPRRPRVQALLGDRGCGLLGCLFDGRRRGGSIRRGHRGQCRVNALELPVELGRRLVVEWGDREVCHFAGGARSSRRVRSGASVRRLVGRSRPLRALRARGSRPAGGVAPPRAASAARSVCAPVRGSRTGLTRRWMRPSPSASPRAFRCAYLRRASSVCPSLRSGGESVCVSRLGAHCGSTTRTNCATLRARPERDPTRGRLEVGRNMISCSRSAQRSSPTGVE